MLRIEHPTHAPGLRRRSLLALLPALASACSPVPQRPLSVGISTFVLHDLAMLARESGFLSTAGGGVRLVEFEDLSDAQRAFEQGQLDGLATTLVEVLITRGGGTRDLRVVRVIAQSQGADMLLAPRTVRSVAELRGRKVGVEIGSLGHYLLARALEQAGLGLKDVVAVSMAQHAMPAALAAGDVAAVVTYPPTAWGLHADPRWHPLFTSQALPGEIMHVWAFDRRVILQRRQVVQAFLDGMDRASQRLAAEPGASCAVMAVRGHVEVQTYCTRLLDGLQWVPPDRQLDYLGPTKGLHGTVERVQQALERSGLGTAAPGVTDCLEALGT